MKKLISTLLAAVMLLTLSSCVTPGEGDETTTDSSVMTTDATETEAPAPDPLILAENGEAKYTVVYPEDAAESVKTSAINFRKNLNRFTKLETSTEYPIATDWYKPTEPPSANDLEILIGKTNREESQSVYASIAEDTYVIKVVGKKLIIAASDDNLLPYAMTYFENYFLINKDITSDGGCVIPGDTEVVFNIAEPDLKKMVSSSYSVTAEFTNLYETSGTGNNKYTQGSCTDGTYVYISYHYKDANNVESSYIGKVRMSDWSVVATSEKLSLNHCNDMTYNPDTNKIVIANMDGPKLTLVDPDTLEVTETISLNTSYTPYAITYSASRQQYVIAASGRFIFVDNDFNIVADKAKATNNNYTGQGMDSDENFIYMPMSTKAEAGTEDNIILVFDWDCNLVKTIKIDTKMESETMFNTGGVQYVSFNNWGNSKIIMIASLEYYLNY